MSFADPQTVTISGTPISLPRVSQEGDETVYQSADGLVQLLASHDYGKRTRRIVRINHKKITPDPFVPSENMEASMSAYLVFDVPKGNVGYTAAEQKAVYDGLKVQLAASSDVLITKLLAGES